MQKTAERAWQLVRMVPEANAAFPSFHPVIAGLLWQRGIRTPREAEYFLNPDYDRDIHDPFLFSDMGRAVDRIMSAIEAGEHITIHGDYDADGVTGSAVLMSAMRDLCRMMGRDAAMIDFYIPHREREGYGLHDATVDALHERGTNLIITVDCGIACREAIARAKQHGIDTIVVDHHESPALLPEAILIHPRLPGETYPFPYLAAVGVAWKVACALYHRARERGLEVATHAEKWLLDLVAIATVTDVMPLVGENRVLEHYGLKVLAKTRRLGLQKLYEVSGVKPEKIDTFSVGFQIGPRINAAGRMEHAAGAFELLMADTPDRATLLARTLHDQNTARQELTVRMMEEARRQVLERQTSQLLWAFSDDWSPGLVGLVAGKLAQEFARPVIVMGRVGDRIVGSGRSVPGFHITDALRKVADCLERFGGHPQACGFTVFTERREEFVSRLVEVAALELDGQTLVPATVVDGELALRDLSLDFAAELVRFAPHGEANPVPRFVTRNLTVLASTGVGENGRHVRLALRAPDGTTMKFIAFGFADRAPTLGAFIDVVYEVGINEWNGSREVQCKLVDYHLNGTTIVTE